MKIKNATGILPNKMPYKIAIESEQLPTVKTISVVLRAKLESGKWFNHSFHSVAYGKVIDFNDALRACFEVVQERAGVNLIEKP